MKRAFIIALVAACSTPPLKLDLAITSSMGATCGSQTCSDIKLGCDVAASIRILDPAQPTAPYISMCQPVIFDRDHDLCSLAGIQLDQKPLPEQTLEVEVVIYLQSQLPVDPMTGDLICPTEREGLSFDEATGFAGGTIAMPDPSDPTLTRMVTAAIGGRAFYHAGDSDTVVTLGCNDLPALDACTTVDKTLVSATVADFDNQLPVASAVAAEILVSVGEPTPDPAATTTKYQLPPTDVSELDRTVVNPPVWGDNVSRQFVDAACVEVLEDGALTTATLTCKPTTIGSSVDIAAFRLAKSSLAQITAAIGNPDPDLVNGLVVGIVVPVPGDPSDPNAQAAGHTIVVTPPAGETATIEYLDATRTSVSGTSLDSPATTGKTTSSGVFVSQDAPFGTTFSTNNAELGSVAAFGGLVEGKVTIVVLQLSKTPGNE